MTQCRFLEAGLLLVLMNIVQGGPGDEISVKMVSKGNNIFSSEMLDKLCEAKPGENIFFSPFSITSVLGMTYVGAKQNTASQMQQGLQFPVDRTTFYQGHKKLQETLTGNLNVTLEMANRLYIAEKFELLPEFKTTTEEYFGATATKLDFNKNVQAAKVINDDVATITHDKIKDLISSDSLDGNTKLVLVNGIYFKGKWATPFDERLTHPQTFHVTNDQKIENVQMMHQVDSFFYADIPEINAQVLIMPYEGKKVEMVLILPKTTEGLSETVTKFKNNYSWEEMIRAVSKVTVKVFIPRFKIETEMNLIDPLKALGMTDMFGTSADLSGISGKPNLFISEVIQKAFIEVNEEGSEAAAATGVIVVAESLPIVPEIVHLFKADHSFLYAIREVNSGTVLFMGAYKLPK